MNKNEEKMIDALLEIRLTSEKDFNKLIVLIASGSIVLSVSFLGFLIPNDISKTICIVFVSWFFLVSTLFLNLYSYISSVKSIDKSLKKYRIKSKLLSQDENDQNNDNINQKTEIEKINNQISKKILISKVQDKLTFILLFLGVISLIIYIGVKLWSKI